MIIINLTGGLGNQMFQYAYGRRLSEDLKTDLKYHFVNALFNTPRRFELDKFKTKITRASDSDLKKLGIFQNRYINRFLYLVDDRFKIQLNKNILTEHTPYLFTDFPKYVPDNRYLQGYFADERYFIKIEKILREEFKPKNKVSDINKDYLTKMETLNSVSIHVRRGDYVTNEVNARLIGFLGLGYYVNAIRKIKEIVPNPTFFVFSDDISWCKENLSFLSKNIYFVNHNKGSDSYMDMILMGACKHNVIANSTFSWWGCWLNKNSKAITIQPKNFENISCSKEKRIYISI